MREETKEKAQMTDLEKWADGARETLRTIRDFIRNLPAAQSTVRIDEVAMSRLHSFPEPPKEEDLKIVVVYVKEELSAKEVTISKEQFEKLLEKAGRGK